MKTKHLIWAALALPAIFAACSNEEFMTETNNPAVNSEVIEGIKFTVTKGDGVDTRLNENGWEDGDIVGLAYRGEGKDEKVYANHALKYDKAGNFFASSSLIYVGEHFAYFPFDEDHLSIEPLTVELANVQEVGKENDLIWKDGFSISAKDQLTKDNGSGYGKNAEFELARVTNTLRLNVIAGNVGNITPADIKLKSVKVAIGDSKKPFVQSVEVEPSKLPDAVHTAFKALGESATDAQKAAAKAEDKADTKEAMALSKIYGETGKALNYTTGVAKLETTIKGDVSINTKYGVNMLTFPTVDNTVEAADITVTIVTNYGTVSITSVSDAPAGETAAAKAIRLENNAAITKLVALLSDGGHTVGGKTYKLSEVNAAPLALSFTADMGLSELTEITIANDADVAEALKIATNVKGVNTFNITGDASIDLTNVPTNVATINVSSTKTLTVSGEVKHDIEFTGDGSVKVAEGAELTINGTIPSPRTLTTANLVNWGTITIGAYGTLELSGTANINHSLITNNGKLNLATGAALTNDKALKTTGHPACEGVLDNVNAITGEAGTYIVNKGTLHQRGTITTVIFKDAISGSEAAVTGSVAISYNGAALPNNCGDIKQANVKTPDEMKKAISSGANTIEVDGVVSVDQELAADADLTFILKNQTEFYILTGTMNDEGDTYKVNIKVTGDDVKLVTVNPAIYLSIDKLVVEKNAKLTIGESGDAYANKTAINVADLNYAGTVVNNGWVFAKAVSGNSGSWSGMSVNKKETSATNKTEVIISSAISDR
jgi:hypothetical protein